jgi:hypothetical protein
MDTNSGRTEITVQTNVISTFLLALLLLPKLRETTAKLKTVPHLVIVTSEVHHIAAFKERHKEDIYTELSNEKAYVQFGSDRYACHQRIHSKGILDRRMR